MSPTVKKLRRLLRAEGIAIGETGVALMREASEMNDEQAQEWINSILEDKKDGHQ